MALLRPFVPAKFLSGCTPAPGGDAVPVSPPDHEHADNDEGGHANTPPVYNGFVRVVHYQVAPLAGMTASLQILDDSAISHPFKGLRVGRGAGHRLHIVVSQPRPDGDEDVCLYSGEGMLTRWSEDCVTGMNVTLRFDSGPDGADRHPLTGIEPGRKGGEAVFLACWAVNDDETVQHPGEARRTRKPWSAKSAVEQSQIKCRYDDDFQEWCIIEAGDLLSPEMFATLPAPEDGRVAFAEAMVRAYCGVASRSAFNADTVEGFQARQQWQRMMRLFDAWRRHPWDEAPDDSVAD